MPAACGSELVSFTPDIAPWAGACGTRRADIPGLDHIAGTPLSSVMTMIDRDAPASIWLASASPRRVELLAQLGVSVQQLPVEVDEAGLPGETGAAMVERLALKKGRAALAQASRKYPDFAQRPLLAADTTVVSGDEVLGKPAGEADAVRMLGLLSGTRHWVYTAVAVMNHDREQVLVSRTGVKFRAMTEQEIQAYWRSGEPAGKAGAYAIQGLGAVFIEEIQGSYSGVMGLPLFETAALLESFGIAPVDRPLPDSVSPA